MVSPFSDPHLWEVIGILLVIEILAIAFYLFLKYYNPKGRKGCGDLGTAKARKPLGQSGVLAEIERLRLGGEMDKLLVRTLSADDRILFEVSLIEALSKWPREDQHRLRSTLIKNGYDEHCARRLMRGDISDRVRASSLLALLRPQSHAKPVESEEGVRGTEKSLPQIIKNSAPPKPTPEQ